MVQLVAHQVLIPHPNKICIPGYGECIALLTIFRRGGGGEGEGEGRRGGGGSWESNAFPISWIYVFVFRFTVIAAAAFLMEHASFISPTWYFLPTWAINGALSVLPLKWPPVMQLVGSKRYGLTPTLKWPPFMQLVGSKRYGLTPTVFLFYSRTALIRVLYIVTTDQWYRWLPQRIHVTTKTWWSQFF